MAAGAKIIEGLKDAVAGNFSRVTIDGQTWARTDVPEEAPARCFMDGIDWQHHLAGDKLGTLLFPTEESLRAEKTCLSGGCGVVEVEVSLVRWVEPQDLKFEEG